MSLGISNIAGGNGALAGSGLSQDGAAAAKTFLDALLGQQDAPKSGGEAFLADVKDARKPEEKRALIDGFAEGFAAASQGAEDGGQAGAANRSVGADGAGGAAQAGGADAAGEGGEAGSPQDLMSGFQEIADRVADSGLPDKAKNLLLDGIAGLMSKLKAEAPSQPQGGSAAGAGAGSANGSGSAANAGAANGSCEAPGAEGTGSTEGANGASAADPSSEASANNGVWTHEVKDGEATIRLGDKYTVTANEKDASFTVKNNETGQSTRVHGDPHVDKDGDGKDDFDFKKDLSFKLDDGTKITVGTVPGGENGTTFSSKLTITNGENAIQVSGLGDKHDGEGNLAVKQSMEGETIDGLENDGSTTIFENGGAWQTRDGKAVDQSVIDAAEA